MDRSSGRELRAVTEGAGARPEGGLVQCGHGGGHRDTVRSYTANGSRPVEVTTTRSAVGRMMSTGS